jgi:hypothetical protein
MSSRQQKRERRMVAGQVEDVQARKDLDPGQTRSSPCSSMLTTLPLPHSALDHGYLRFAVQLIHNISTHRIVCLPKPYLSFIATDTPWRSRSHRCTLHA